MSHTFRHLGMFNAARCSGQALQVLKSLLVIGVLAATTTACDSNDPPEPPPDTTPPFGSYIVLDGDTGDYVEIPHASALNPTDAITLEGWVRFDAIDCPSLIGKNYLQAYWIGECGGGLRSYIGSSSSANGGSFALGTWIHWAVTSDGSVRRHYINGILADEFAETGGIRTSTDPVRIGSDVSFEEPVEAALDEFRIWNVDRTQAQIQNTMNEAITSPMPGLVAVWSLDGDGRDALGNHNGAVVGDPAFETDSTP